MRIMFIEKRFVIDTNCFEGSLNNFGHKMVTPFRIPSSATYCKSLFDNMGDTGLELVTPCLSSKRKK